jgi:tetratricopeptide (TPR) repeat protein
MKDCLRLIHKVNHSKRAGHFLRKTRHIYQEQGDFKKALQFFEQRSQLSRDCLRLIHKVNHSKRAGHFLRKTGDIYQQQGDFKRLYSSFEQDLQL